MAWKKERAGGLSQYMNSTPSKGLLCFGGNGKGVAESCLAILNGSSRARGIQPFGYKNLTKNHPGMDLCIVSDEVCKLPRKSPCAYPTFRTPHQKLIYTTTFKSLNYTTNLIDIGLIIH